MNKQSAALLKWAGILLIFANFMAWEGQPATRMPLPKGALTSACCSKWCT